MNRILDAYLLDGRSRLTLQPADHFKAGARHWYNLLRGRESRTKQFKHATTSNTAKKVAYRLAVAVQIAITESNVFVVNNRLAHVKPLEPGRSSAARGDGTIMAPSLRAIFERANSLDPHHPAYLESWEMLRLTGRAFRDLRPPPPAADAVLAQAFVLMNRIQYLVKLGDEERIREYQVRDLTPNALRRRVKLESARPEDYQLSPALWTLLGTVDWERVLTTAYGLFCAQQTVCLWGSRTSVNVSAALLLVSLEAEIGDVLASLTALTRELVLPHAGSEHNVLRRRSELQRLIVGWSSSFPTARLTIPIIPPPKKGTVGTGLTGYASDKRRGIPEAVMVNAAAPVVAAHWDLLMRTRLATRNPPWSLRREYRTAAEMFARAHNHDMQMRKIAAKNAKKAQAAARKTASTPASRHPSPASPSVVSLRAVSQPPGAALPTPRGSTPGAGRKPTSREDMLRMMDVPIETLLATREDSSDEEADAETDDESRPDILTGDTRPSSVPFGFSIGPDGFSVARDASEPPKRPAPTATEVPSKRPRIGPQIPLSPPTTASSREPSPARTVRILKTSRATTAATSLRSVSMSPTPSHASTLVPVQESDATRHIGLLLREREIYAFFNADAERRRGFAVSKEIEAAMNAWLSAQRKAGRIPAKFDAAYYKQLGFDDDPHESDVGPFIARHSEWSPTECLLRLGIRPIEFPAHFVVHSMAQLRRELYGEDPEAELAPEGELIGPGELDRELAVLFATPGERISDILCSETEVQQRRTLYERIWAESEGRCVAAAQKQIDSTGVVEDDDEGEEEAVAAPVQRGSRRINMAVLAKLCGDEEDEDVGAAMRYDGLGIPSVGGLGEDEEED